MLLFSTNKSPTKKLEDLLLQTELKERLASLTSSSFVAIAGNDPDDIAEKIREACKDYHENNKEWEFHLLDEKRKQITYYGNCDERKVLLESMVDLRMTHALSTLTAEPNKSKIWAIRKPYDYAWVKKAIDYRLVEGVDRLWGLNANSFITYIKSLGFENIDEKQTFNKYCSEVTNSSYPFVYESHRRRGELISDDETRRRNAIVSKFMSLMLGD